MPNSGPSVRDWADRPSGRNHTRHDGGKDLEAKVQSAAKLEVSRIRDYSMVASMLIQQPERWEIRNRR
jgi:hypothetical protein